MKKQNSLTWMQKFTRLFRQIAGRVTTHSLPLPSGTKRRTILSRGRKMTAIKDDPQRWPNFKVSEFACKCGCGTNLIQPHYLDRLQGLRTKVGEPIPVGSGYRCPKHNQKVSSTGPNGPHTTGRASDVRVSHQLAYKILQEAPRFGFTGIGVAQKGDVKGRFIHLDDLPDRPRGPRPHVWSY